MARPADPVKIRTDRPSTAPHAEDIAELYRRVDALAEALARLTALVLSGQTTSSKE